MGWKDIRDEIVSTLQGVAGIGQVYTYLPDVKTEEDVVSKFKNPATGDIRFWVVRRRSGADNRDRQPLTQSVRRHHFRIQGYLSYQDSPAGEEEFQDLVDAVVEAFAPKITMGGTAEVVYGVTFECGEESVGPYLCRAVSIDLTADIRHTRAYA
jgi:hypothetical protein